MAPLTRLQRSKICWFGDIPIEIALMIARNLPLKDKLAFTDTCRACRTFVSHKECIRACRKAGLSQVDGVSPRAMAKLLCRPRKGVCNWSHEDGVPKKNLDFSRAYSVGGAILKDVKVALHPSFDPARYLYLCETKSFDQVKLRVARKEPDILLCENRLYMHEYATSPPLKELRVLIKEDEGVLDDGEVVFRIRNPTGVTLGNYWEGLFTFFHQEPDPNMYLTANILLEWYTMLFFGGPFDPFVASDSDEDENEDEDEDNEHDGSSNRHQDSHSTDQSSSSEDSSDDDETSADSDDGEIPNPYFDRDCSTNLAMLDTYCARLEEDIPFSDKGLKCELPLYRGSLVLMIHATDPHTSRSRHFLRQLEHGIHWGEPRTALFWDGEPIMELDDDEEEFWEESAPLIQF
ncbi:hypothetical protein B0H21DRAFT_767146 [Amylocystis lapponica]|nr:hypothetical protein B0H21DRAFT_767146 [Amylocystis lapponica]